MRLWTQLPNIHEQLICPHLYSTIQYITVHYKIDGLIVKLWTNKFIFCLFADCWGEEEKRRGYLLTSCTLIHFKHKGTWFLHDDICFVSFPVLLQQLYLFSQQADTCLENWRSKEVTMKFCFSFCRAKKIPPSFTAHSVVSMKPLPAVVKYMRKYGM